MGAAPALQYHSQPPSSSAVDSVPPSVPQVHHAISQSMIAAASGGTTTASLQYPMQANVSLVEDI